MNYTEKLMIGYILAQNRILTASVIAKELHVTSRTVFNLIESCRSECIEHGFQISGKPHVGLEIIVSDPDRFFAYREKAILAYELMKQTSFFPNEYALYLARKFLSTESAVSMDTLCKEMNISLPTLRRAIKKLQEYLHDFSIEIKRNGNRLTLHGSEFHKRWAAIIFLRETMNPGKLQSALDEYKKLFDGLNAFQTISSILARCLCENHFTLLDISFQNYVHYLIISGNRFKNGHHLNSQSFSLLQLKNHPVYQIANEIMEKIIEVFPATYDYDQSEIFQFALLLLAYEDTDDYRNFFNYLQNTRIIHRSSKILSAVKQHLTEIYEFPTNDNEFNQKLHMVIAQVLLLKDTSSNFQIKKHGFLYNNRMNASPLCIYLSFEICKTIESQIKTILFIEHYYIISFILKEYFSSLSIPYHRKKLLTVSSTGSGQAKDMADILLAHYSNVISSVKPVPLYEAIFTDQRSYDYLVCDMSALNSVLSVSYNKTVPLLVFDPRVEKLVDDEPLFRLDESNQFLPEDSFFRMTEISIDHLDNFIQILNLHYRGSKVSENLNEYLSILQLNQNDKNIIIQLPCSVTRQEFAELYHLKEPILNNGVFIYNIWLISINFHQDGRRALLWEQILNTLTAYDKPLNNAYIKQILAERMRNHIPS